MLKEKDKNPRKLSLFFVGAKFARDEILSITNLEDKSKFL